MTRFYVYGLMVLASLVVLFTVDANRVLFQIALTLLGAFGVLFVEAAAKGRTDLRLTWYGLRHRGALVRVSVSYLFRIKVDGRYLLIAGHRFPQYQPVGGVYKVTGSAKAFLDALPALDDDLVPLDAVSELDLRLRIPADKLPSFYRWFETGRHRETSPWREFSEELIASGVLSASVFPHIYHEFLGRQVRSLRYSPHAASLELMIADIYELLPSAAQLAALKALQKTPANTSLHWAKESEIRRRGAVPGENQRYVVAETAQWLLEV